MPDLEEQFTKYYKQWITVPEVQFTATQSTRHLEFHPSTSTPYCPLKHFYQISKTDPTLPREQDFKMTAAVEMGTTFHRIIQNCLGRGGRLVGNWACRKCGHETKVTTYSACPKCSSGAIEYHELAVKIGKRTLGHMDGIFQLADGTYILIDYKTTRSSKILKYKKAKEGFPVAKNVEQIKSYCYYAYKLYGLNITGYALVYAGRDDVLNDIVVVGERLSKNQIETIGKELKQWDTQFDEVLNVTSIEDLELLIEAKPCSNFDDYYARYHDTYDPCPLRGVCFTPHLKPTLEDSFQDAAWLPLLKPGLVIFDSNWIAMRAIHGYKDQPLLYGFMQIVGKILTRLNPSHILFVFDGNGKTWRHNLYPEYKANRNSTSDEVKATIKDLITILKEMNLAVLQVDNQEADDLIYSAVKEFKPFFNRIYVSSADKDLMTLVSRTVSLYNDQTDTIFNRTKVQEHFGVPVESMMDYLALMGDTVDNIPGCAKIGKKGAAKIIEAGNIEEHLTEDQHKDYLISKELVQLRYFNTYLTINLLKIKNITLDVVKRKKIPRHPYFFRFD